ncbi:glycosyltransferase [Agrobacterium rhizogenes]|jgi:glycosyltransferase involved in cell wall biosynthesis|nr:glycosyltransferase [Rhizobium rhizogenes]NTJ49083.1 glycosyltransferase [Rhizobium rhizogenes]
MTAETQSPILRSAPSNIGDLLRQGYRRVCFGYCVPTGVISSWVSCGPSFQLQYDIETDIGLDKLVYWWLRHGRHTFEGLSAAIDPHFLFETHLSILAEDKNFASNSPLFQIIQRHREDIRDLHDISTQEGILAFWNWWLQSGRAEYFGDLDWFQTQEIVNVLNGALNDGENAPDLVVDGIRYLQLVYLKTWILDETGPVSDLVNRLHFAFLHNGFVSPTPLQWIIYRNRADLRATMDLNTHEGVFAFWTWWLSHGHDEYLGGAVWIKQKQAFFLLDSLEHEADTWDVLRHEALSQIKSLRLIDRDSDRQTFDSIHCKSLRVHHGDDGHLTPLMLLVHRNRADLRQTFSLQTDDDLIHYWQWWLTSGSKEYFEGMPSLLRAEISEFLSGLRPGNSAIVSAFDAMRYDLLSQIKTILTNDDCSPRNLVNAIHFDHLLDADGKISHTPTPLMSLIYRNRPDLQAAFDLDTAGGLTGLWSWWFADGKDEYLGSSDWIAAQHATALLGGLQQGNAEASPYDAIRYGAISQLEPVLANGSHALDDLINAIHFNHLRDAGGKLSHTPTPLMSLIYRNRPDLQTAFDLNKPQAVPAFWDWWFNHGQSEYFGKTAGRISGTDNTVAASGHDVAAAITFTKSGEAPASEAPAPNISLVGYPKGEFGLGEDIRLLRASLNEVGIKPTVVKAPWAIMARQAIDEPSVEASMDAFDGDVMIYVMPAFDTMTLLNKVGPRAFTARRKIGFWQWELERFPPPAKIAMELVDEIWCHSEHSARAFRSATDKPVIKVPLPVLVPDVRVVPRSKFDLENDSFVVFTSFDGASSISRKNPLGAIQAFQKAFPAATRSKARLIVKAMNTLDDSLWRECMRKAVIDDRILIRDGVMDRLEYYELLQCCDAVLSLHRAEGFGRLMAEAMAMGIPVIASGYSGNLDFMDDSNSWLVKGVQIPVFSGDYAFFQDQMWFEPDIDSAAAALRECAEDHEKCRRLASAAKETMERYSPQICGARYLDILRS